MVNLISQSCVTACVHFLSSEFERWTLIHFLLFLFLGKFLNTSSQRKNTVPRLRTVDLSIAIPHEIFIFFTYIHVYPCIDSKRDLTRIVKVQNGAKRQQVSSIGMSSGERILGVQFRLRLFETSPETRLIKSELKSKQNDLMI